MIGPNANAISLAELQKLVPLGDVRSNDHRSSIHRDTRASHLYRVIGLDARRQLVDDQAGPAAPRRVPARSVAVH